MRELQATNDVESDFLATMQAEADQVFPAWAASHEGEYIKTIPCNPEDEHQDISIVSFDALPSLEIATQIGYMGLGLVSDRIVGDLQRLGIVDLAKDRVAKKRGLLVSSLHLNSVLDAAATHNQLFVASEDEAFAQHNVLLANPMLAWTAMKGVETMVALRKAGRVVRGIPLDGAKKHGLSGKLVDFVDRRAAPVLVDVFRNGEVIHRAPSGTRAVKILLKDGTPALSVPRLGVMQTRTIRKRTDKVVGIPMDVNGDNSVAQVLKPRDINQDSDVHVHMEEMVDTINGLVDYEVVYGMPTGAIKTKQD